MDSQSEFEGQSHWFTESSLEESLRPGECLVCSNLIHVERHSIHSFLWEGMMSAHVRSAFLKGGGFCARHSWMAKRIEDDDWPAGGVGMAILCENLIEHAIANLPSSKDIDQACGRGSFRRKRELQVSLPGFDCIFCRERMDREQSLIEALQYLRHRPEWAKHLKGSPLCVHHALLAFRIWQLPEDKQHLYSGLAARLRELQAQLREFIRKHDWNYRDEPLGPERDSLIHAMQILTGPKNQFPFQKAVIEKENS